LFVIILSMYEGVTLCVKHMSPSLFKFVQLLNETSKQVLVELSSFCLKAFKRRGEHLNV